ncbi:MAG: hypothetical protein IPJ85_14225 [Flavobacteriales bacterium]|nr:hypothetical protein [Flavobacteriales bacterium]
MSPTYSYTATTQPDGSYAIVGAFADTYAVTAGSRGGIRRALAPQLLSAQGTNVVDMQLQPGYADDFALNLGWSTSAMATAVFWERGVPVGTVLGNSPSNPGADVRKVIAAIRPM